MPCYPAFPRPAVRLGEGPEIGFGFDGRGKTREGEPKVRRNGNYQRMDLGVRMQGRWFRLFLLISAGFLLGSSTVHGAKVALTPVQDATLLEESTGSLGNSAGTHLFAGRTAQVNEPLRRTLLQFDVSGIPAQAILQSVTLSLHVSMVPLAGGMDPFYLHRVTSDWTEGTSDPIGQEGIGTTAQPNDPTWIHRSFSSANWTTPGGDYDPTVSASLTIASFGSYDLGPTPQMMADVRDWIDNPSGNLGWMILGDETAQKTARRFDSREHGTPAFRPTLTVEFFEITGLEGTVNTGAGMASDVLLINGSAGDAFRRVSVASGANMTIDFGAPPMGAGAGRYCLYVWRQLPTNSKDLMTGGQVVGTFGNPIPLTGCSPQPFRCARSAGFPPILCAGVREVTALPSAYPWTVPTSAPTIPGAFLLQALCQDQGAGNPTGFSVSNGVILLVE